MWLADILLLGKKFFLIHNISAIPAGISKCSNIKLTFILKVDQQKILTYI